MLETLKKSSVGKRLYRVSRRGGAGKALQSLARVLQAELLQPAHYSPRNIAHNRRQAQSLERFVKGLEK